MINLMHVVDLPCANPWLNGVASHHDRGRFRTLVASIGPRTSLHEALEERQIGTFALDAPSRCEIPLAVCRLARLLRREKVDILQTHLFYPSTVGLLAAKLAGTPLRIVTRHHSDFTTIFRRPVHRFIDRLHAMSADRVMAASEAVRQSMIRYEGVPPHRITVARYGYDFTLLRPRLTAGERQALRQSVGRGHNFLIGTIARLSVEKGHEYLIRAMPAIIRANPEVCFVFVGAGPLERQLVKMTSDFGMDKHVRFLGWRSDARDLMEAMDLIVHPSLHEAFCSVIIESMALERPLISTNVAAAPEQLDHGRSGILVPPRDATSIAEAVVEVMKDDRGSSEMGKEARRRVQERFNFPGMMREYEDCYVQWLSQKRKCPPNDRAVYTTD